MDDIKKLAEFAGVEPAQYLNPDSTWAWNPKTRIQDAFMLLDKCDQYKLTKVPSGRKLCTAYFEDKFGVSAGASECEAICAAVLELMEAK